MRYFAHIAYCGYCYRGWQNQVNVITVQSTIENAFRQLFGKRIYCHGCGRTDSMVNASSYYFHFDTSEPIDPNLCNKLNKILPDDITIIKIFEVEPHSDSQHSAIERTYQYRIHTQKNPFIGRFSALYEGKQLNFYDMCQAVKLLSQHCNYKNFCITPARHSSTLVEVKKAELTTNSDNTEFCFTITANHFLHGMIRIIVYRLIMVGQQTMSLETFHELLHGNPTSIPVKRAYPQGLSLTDIKYSFTH